jgi:hypothetical protein
MEKVLNMLLPSHIIKKIYSYIPIDSIGTCLYCGQIYKDKNIKFHNPENCYCYYKWIYFHSSDYYHYN